MKVVKIKKAICTLCNAELNFVHNQEGTIPNPGDIAICSECLHVGQYDVDGNIIECDKETLLQISTDAELRSELLKLQEYLLSERFAH